MLKLAQGVYPAQVDVVAHMNFDLDDPGDCLERKLLSSTCLGFNDASNAIAPTWDFPWTNSLSNGAEPVA